MFDSKSYQTIFKRTSLSQRILIDNNTHRVFSGFNRLDSSVRGFTSGDVYIVGGHEKSGKTDFLQQIVQNFLNSGNKVGYLNTELADRMFFIRMAARWKGVTKMEAELNSGLLKEWINRFESNFYYAGVKDLTDESTNQRNFEKTMKVAKEFVELGAEVLIYDNLTTFNSGGSQSKKGWEVLAGCISAVINFSKLNNIISFVVIHTKPQVIFSELPSGIKRIIDEGRPEKIIQESATVIRRPTSTDLYGGGGAISQISGAILIWRPFQKFHLDEWRKLTLIILDTFRDSASGVEIQMDFDGAKGIFTENE